jgi:hypothetical protein
MRPPTSTTQWEVLASLKDTEVAVEVLVSPQLARSLPPNLSIEAVPSQQLLGA